MTDITVSETARLYARASRVWETVGGFHTIAAWHPRVRGDKEDRDGTQKVRRLDVAADEPLVERLESHDDRAMRYDYSVISGPLPVREASGRLWITAERVGSCTVYWELRFSPAGVTRADAIKAVQDYIRAGLESLRFRLGA